LRSNSDHVQPFHFPSRAFYWIGHLGSIWSWWTWI
jgi:hypothetical protein